MGQACHICNHPDRLEIDRQLVKGISHSKIVREFEVPYDSLRYHSLNHLSRQLIKSQEMQEAIQSGGLVAEIESLLARSKNILDKAEAKGQMNLALNAIKETRGTLDLLARIAATLHQIRAQELQQQQSENDEQREIYDKEQVARLTDDELSMLIALGEKLSGERKDDVITSVLREQGNRYIPITPYIPSHQYQAKPKRRRTRPPVTEEEDESTPDNQAADVKSSGVWSGREDPFARAVVPGSIRTNSPELRKLLDLD